MNITKRAKIAAGALALAGAVTLTGGAFTASGLGNDAGSSQFVGGVVEQSVTGAATLSGVVYTYTDVSNTAANDVDLTFSVMDDQDSDVSVSINDGLWIECTGNGSLARDCDLPNVSVNKLEVRVEAPGTFVEQV